MAGGGRSQLTVRSATRAQRRTTASIRWCSQHTLPLPWLNSSVYKKNEQERRKKSMDQSVFFSFFNKVLL